MAEYFTVSIKEQGQVLVTDKSPSDTLTIIGPALDGPTNKPVRITSPTQAEAVFGPLVYSEIFVNPYTDVADGKYSQNALVKAYNEAIAGGARDVFLCRAGGSIASNSLGGLTFKALSPGLQYNSISVAIQNNAVAAGTGTVTGTVTLTQPTRYGGTVVYTFNSSDTIDDLVRRINSDGSSNYVRVVRNTALSPYTAATVLSITGTVSLTGGTYGTEAKGDDNYNGKYALYTALTTAETGTFDSITEFDTDLVMLAGIYLDDQVVTGSAATTTSIVNSFANFCYNKSTFYPVHGFIGLRPTGYDGFDSDTISTHILNNWESTSAGYIDANLHWIKAGYFRNQGVLVTDTKTQEVQDYSSYISVVAGPEVQANLAGIGFYNEAPTAWYAGLVSSLPSESGATRKTLKGVYGLRYSIKEKQVRRLVNGIGWSESTPKIPGKGSFVLFRPSAINQLPEVVFDETFANDRTLAFSTLSMQRVAFEAIKLLRNALLVFVGEAYTTELQIAMEERARAILNGMVTEGKLAPGGENVSYQFSLNATNPLGIANNEVNVDLVLVPALQVKRIRTSVVVKKTS